MSGTLRYRVHGVAQTSQLQTVIFEGQEITSPVPALEVELAWDSKDNRDHGSMTLRFVGADIAWARETFVGGADVDLTFAGPLNVPEPAAEPAPAEEAPANA